MRPWWERPSLVASVLATPPLVALVAFIVVHIWVLKP